MKTILGASQIIKNIQSLKGFSTKRQIADFFDVSPSAVTDWTNRKGDHIPARRLAEASSRHGLSWHWLAYGEGEPYEVSTTETSTNMALDPDDLALIEKIKTSRIFRQAVLRLAALDEKNLKIVASVADAMPGAEEKAKTKAPKAPFLMWQTGFPLTRR